MKDVDVKHYKPISLIDHSRVRLIFSMNTELYTRFPLLQKSLLDNLKNISITDSFLQFSEKCTRILSEVSLDPHKEYFFWCLFYYPSLSNHS